MYNIKMRNIIGGYFNYKSSHIFRDGAIYNLHISTAD